MKTYRMIIGPNETFTETLSQADIDTLVSLGILRKAEHIVHPHSDSETIVYRMARDEDAEREAYTRGYDDGESKSGWDF